MNIVRRWLFALLLLPCLAVPPLHAAELILSSAGDTQSLKGFSSALASLRSEDSIRVVALNDLPPLNELPADTRLILFGQAALAWRLSSDEGPATLVLQVNQAQAMSTLGKRRPDRLSLLWADAAPARQLRLIRHLLPHARRVGVLHDEHSGTMLSELQAAAAPLNLEIVPEQWSNTRDNRPLLNALQDSDLLLAIADDDLYNAQTAKNLLLTSYSQQRAMIGPSAGFVRAGSLASTYSDQEDWLSTLDALLDLPPEQWPASSYAHAFKVVGNRQVARALAVDLPDDDALTRLLSEGETR